MPTHDEILDAMRHIIDPDLGRDIVSLGFIKNLAVDGGHVRFTVELTTPACPVKDEFRTRCAEAVQALPGVESVEVEMSAMARAQRGPTINTLTEVGAIVAVSSCKGGVGKSTVAAHLARAMQREGLAVGLLDADVYGPSVPTLFNTHHPDVRFDGKHIIPVEIDGLKVMSLGFLLGEAPAVLRGPIVSGYVQQVLQQTQWGALDYLIIDLPPGTGDIQLTIVQQAALDGTVIVTTPQALSLVDVARGVLMFEKVQVPVLGIVENMSYFDCSECAARHYPFGRSRQALQQRFGLPTLAELPILAQLTDASARSAGDGVAAFAQMADQIHREIGKRRMAGPSTPEVRVGADIVEVAWPDGFRVAFPCHTLRAACPCALCVDENSGERILDPADIPADIAVQDMQNLGHYAVAFHWTDGHSTGIYAWDYLRELAATLRRDAPVE